MAYFATGKTQPLDALIGDRLFETVDDDGIYKGSVDINLNA